MGEDQKNIQEKEVMFRELYSRYMEEVKRGESLDFLPAAAKGRGRTGRSPDYPVRSGGRSARICGITPGKTVQDSRKVRIHPCREDEPGGICFGVYCKLPVWLTRRGLPQGRCAPCGPLAVGAGRRRKENHEKTSMSDFIPDDRGRKEPAGSENPERRNEPAGVFKKGSAGSTDHKPGALEGAFPRVKTSGE